jgi:hypothetical protein
MKTFKEFLLESFSEEEKVAIENYTDQPHFSNKKIINRLAERERTKKNLVLHLGMNQEKAKELGIHNPIQKPTTIKLKDVQSASKYSKIASRFGNIRIVLEHPKGSKGLNIPNELSSRIVPEHEFVLPKGHIMLVHRSETDNKGGITHYGITINDEKQ